MPSLEIDEAIGEKEGRRLDASKKSGGRGKQMRIMG